MDHIQSQQTEAVEAFPERTDFDALIANTTILIVDDLPDNVALLQRLLAQAGYPNVHSVTDAREAVAAVAAIEPDLLLLDLRMPHLDGFAVMAALHERLPEDAVLPILVLTADGENEVRRKALRAGASDFISKPFDALEVLQRTRNLLRIRVLHVLQRNRGERLERLVAERTSALAAANEDLRAMNAALQAAYAEVVARLGRAAEYRDDDTGRHTQRVGSLAAAIARRLGRPDAYCDLLAAAARLHDLGKIGIPDHVLLKPGRLATEEWRIMQQHCEIGAEILEDSESELLLMAQAIARSHHERWNGDGYPLRLRGQAIPLEGRIVAVADVFDALTHSRPYKRAWTMDEALELIRRERGEQFDPEVVDAFLELVDEVRTDAVDELSVLFSLLGEGALEPLYSC